MLKNHNKIAIRTSTQQITYFELLQKSLTYRDSFRQFTQNKKVIIFGNNSAEWIFALYGSWQNDGIAIPVDASSTFDELSYIINDVKPDIVFCDDSKKAMVDLAVSELGLEIPILTAEDIENGTRETEGKVTEVAAYTPADRQKTAVIIYTSGTTGSSKGVMLSFENLFFIVGAVCDDINIFSKEANTMVLLPTHHILPLMGSVVAPLYSGGTIFIAESLAPEVIVKTLQEGKISIIIGVPRLYDSLAKGVMNKINEKKATRIIYRIAEKLKSRTFSKLIFSSVHEKFGGHLKFLVCGGAALPLDTGKIFKTLGFEVLEGYGMTETSPLITFTHPGKWTVGYAGYTLRGMEMKFVDGEICVKGANVMQGYYNRPEETSDIIKDGWLHTGDLGFLDKYGLKLTGRKKEIMVTSNGKNIDPVQLEEEFCRMSPIIQEVGVFMQDDIIQAIIYPNMDEIRSQSLNISELPELMKETLLQFNEKTSSYKRIKQFHIISEELPKTRMGKIQRYKLSSLINKVEKIKEEENKEYSSQYILLRDFIERETKNKAGENDHFELDLAMDSLSRVALFAYVETTFGVTLNETLLNQLNTLGKLSAYVEEHNTGIVDKKDMEWKEILTAKLSDFTLPESGITNKTLMFIVRYLLRIVYRYRTKGENNIPNEPCIMVANHQSMLDGVLIASTLKRKIGKKTYMFAKDKHWKSQIMGFLARKNNVILMDVNHNLKETIQKLSYVLRNGKNVLIFPEGTRSKSGLQEFKDMFAILSKELNVPIIPIAITGTERAMFQNIKIPRYLAPLSVDFMEKIYPKKEESYKDLKDRVKSIIAEKLHSYKNKKK